MSQMNDLTDSMINNRHTVETGTMQRLHNEEQTALLIGGATNQPTNRWSDSWREMLLLFLPYYYFPWGGAGVNKSATK